MLQIAVDRFQHAEFHTLAEVIHVAEHYDVQRFAGGRCEIELLVIFVGIVVFRGYEFHFDIGMFFSNSAMATSQLSVFFGYQVCSLMVTVPSAALPFEPPPGFLPNLKHIRIR